MNKPAGILVHRTKMNFGETESVVNSLRDQLGAQVFPVHRLDKPTSGTLVFALSSDIARIMQTEFVERRVHKKYLAIVRGYVKEDITIDYPLKEELDRIADKKARQDKPAQEAITKIKVLAQIELPFEVDKYPTSRYSLVLAMPVTGRKHQIRRHLRHINHPIIGDTTHGAAKHNKFFENEFKIKRLLLACTELSFIHPKTNMQMNIKATLPDDFKNLMIKLNWNDHVV
ncbi:MAG: pseudouridine synthase [Bdellovibrionota bacterium]